MPHLPDLRSHPDHDLELVAAYAAGDAAGADLETATTLIAGCAECATLHHDLRAIAAALPGLPAPVRPRDFRLTPEQAAALRPAGWRGIVAALAGPRFRFAAPLGTGLAALGLAGVLVGSLGSVPLGAGGATADDAYSATGPQPSAAAAQAAADPSTLPAASAPASGTAEGAPLVNGDAAASAAPQPVASPNPVPAPTKAAGGASGGTSVSSPATSDDSQVLTGERSLDREAATLGAESPARDPLVLLGGLALVTGVSLVGARVVSRRLR